MCLEAKDRDIVLLGLVESGKLLTELVLGNVRAVGVEDIAENISVSPRFLAVIVRYILHLHNHLATAEEGVADELARAQGNLRIGHVEG